MNYLLLERIECDMANKIILLQITTWFGIRNSNTLPRYGKRIKYRIGNQSYVSVIRYILSIHWRATEASRR